MQRFLLVILFGWTFLLGTVSPGLFASRASAAPTLLVTDGGTANGNQLWRVEVAPDPVLFSETSEGLGGSLSVALDFSISDSEIVSVMTNGAAWPYDNPGFDPFIHGISFGVTADGNTAFISLGSNIVTTDDSVEVVTIETLGAGRGTLRWGGRMADLDGEHDYQTARITQGGQNFDGYQGVLSVAAGLAGDYNGNGLVEQVDLDLVLFHWGDQTPPIPGDWVNDPPSGTIDQTELDRVLLNWGDSRTSQALGRSAVPEPNSMLLVMIGGMLVPLASLRRCGSGR